MLKVLAYDYFFSIYCRCEHIIQINKKFKIQVTSNSVGTSLAPGFLVIKVNSESKQMVS